MFKPRYKKGNVPTPIVVSTRISEAEMYRLERLAAGESASVSRTIRNAITAAYENKKKVGADAA